jgi:hypothetical protein
MDYVVLFEFRFHPTGNSMVRRSIFTDEAGDFAFSRKANESKYFIVCSVTMDTCDVGEALLRLRRDLTWEKAPVDDYFHATSDKHEIRDRVFAIIGQQRDFRVDATILEKSKAQPHICSSKERFYKYPWWYHFKHIGPNIAARAAEIHLTTASVGTKKGQAVYRRSQ